MSQHVEQIPPSIVQAICRIKASMEAVKKSGKNAHGGYSFASTDDIYAALTRKMGEVGLILMSLEDECDIKRFEGKDGKTSQWVHLIFSFVLATEGATWTDKRARRTIYVQVTGPQTFQAAQSYAEKAYLRALFKLPTGDVDLDSLPQGDTEDDQEALSSIGRLPRKSSAEGKRDGSVKVFNAIRTAIQGSLSKEMLQTVRQTYAREWAALPQPWQTTLEDDYSVKMDEHIARDAA